MLQYLYMFSFFRKPIRMVVHDGNFHADDILACAIMQEYYARKGRRLRIIRTRNEHVIARADIVADVGGVYDPTRNRFDHHQPEGAGVRENGIPYASAGLVWKEYGSALCKGVTDGDTLAADAIMQSIDWNIIQPIDAADNGVKTYVSVSETMPSTYSFGGALMSFRPAYGEALSRDRQFLKAVAFARTILQREILRAHGVEITNKKILASYEQTANKTLLVLDEPFSREDINIALSRYDMPEVLLIVYGNGIEEGEGASWSVLTVRKGRDTFEARLPLPAAWAGLRDEKLQVVTGEPSAVFVHRERFMAATTSKAGALRLAKMALVK